MIFFKSLPKYWTKVTVDHTAAAVSGVGAPSVIPLHTDTQAYVFSGAYHLIAFTFWASVFTNVKAEEIHSPDPPPSSPAFKEAWRVL